MTPSISVIIPLFNHEKYIVKAVDSVLQQTHKDLELIVIDDGSADNSYSIVSNISDKRLHLFTQKNQGAHVTINRGIEMANGDYITILNSDDIYYPERLQIFFDILTRSPEIDALFSQVEAIHDDNSHYFLFGNIAKHHIPLKRTVPQRRLAADLLGRNIVTTTSNIICKKDVFNDVGVFHDYRYCHDLDFFLRLFSKKNVQFVDSPLLKYRVHENNTLNENTAMVHFESAIIIADFLRGTSLEDLFPGLSPSQAMAHFFSIFENHRIDRLLHVLSRLDLSEYEWKGLREKLLQKQNHPLRVACMQHIGDQLMEEENLKPHTTKRLLNNSINKTTSRKVISLVKKIINKTAH